MSKVDISREVAVATPRSLIQLSDVIADPLSIRKCGSQIPFQSVCVYTDFDSLNKSLLVCMASSPI